MIFSAGFVVQLLLTASSEIKYWATSLAKKTFEITLAGYAYISVSLSQLHEKKSKIPFALCNQSKVTEILKFNVLFFPFFMPMTTNTDIQRILVKKLSTVGVFAWSCHLAVDHSSQRSIFNIRVPTRVTQNHISHHVTSPYVQEIFRLNFYLGYTPVVSLALFGITGILYKIKQSLINLSKVRHTHMKSNVATH